jgi:hypothetical protein
MRDIFVFHFKSDRIYRITRVIGFKTHKSNIWLIPLILSKDAVPFCVLAQVIRGANTAAQGRWLAVEEKEMDEQATLAQDVSYPATGP